MGIEESRSHTTTRWPIVALACITLAGLALRLTNVGESLWLDELHTGWVVKDAWSDVAWRAQIGNQSPVWFYAVKLVTTLGGESEFTLRLLSLVAGTALMPVAYWLVQLLVPSHNNGVHRACGFAGLLAASLIAVDRHFIFYATEARPYACLQLCAAVQLGLFWQILHQPTTRLRIGWMLLTALSFHLHYTGVLILLGELVVLLGYYLLSRQPVAYRPWRALFDWQIAAMLCLPAIGHVLEVGRRREMWESMSGQPEWEDLLNIFPLHPVPVFRVIRLYPVMVLGFIAGGMALVRWHRGWPTAESQASWTAIGTIALWLVVPLLSAFAAAHFDLARIFLRRYLMAFAIGPMLLTALFLSHISRTTIRGLIAVCVLGIAVYQGGIISQLRYDGRAVGDRNEDWRGAIAWLRKEYPQVGGTIWIRSGLIEEDFRPSQNIEKWDEYFRFPINSLYLMPVKRKDDRFVWIISRTKPDDWPLTWKLIAARRREYSFGKLTIAAIDTGRQSASPFTPPSPQTQSSTP